MKGYILMNGLCNMLHGCRVSRLFLKRDQCMCVFMCVCGLVWFLFLERLWGICCYFITLLEWECFVFIWRHPTYCSFNSALLQRHAEKRRPITLCHGVICEEEMLLIVRLWETEVLLICSFMPTKFTWRIQFKMFLLKYL